MSNELKKYSVSVKALKTNRDENLVINVKKDNKKLFFKSLPCIANLLIKLTDKKHILQEILLEDISTIETFSFEDYDTSELTNISNMFFGCDKLKYIDWSDFDTHSVTKMKGPFKGCYSLSFDNISELDTSNTINMQSMFGDITDEEHPRALTLPALNTSKVTDMNNMFSGNLGLTSLCFTGIIDANNVTNMSYMFNNDPALTSLDLSCFINTDNVTNMNGMFGRCYSLASLDLSTFDTSNVTNMNGMFYSCKNLAEIKGVIDMKSCENHNQMFLGCSKLSGVKIKNPPTGFDGAGLKPEQYEIVK